MEDIEAMFHQVHITEKEKSLGTCVGRMLIWEKLINYEMCVHVSWGHHPLDFVTMLYEEQL